MAIRADPLQHREPVIVGLTGVMDFPRKCESSADPAVLARHVTPEHSSAAALPIRGQLRTPGTASPRHLAVLRAWHQVGALRVPADFPGSRHRPLGLSFDGGHVVSTPARRMMSWCVISGP